MSIQDAPTPKQVKEGPMGAMDAKITIAPFSRLYNARSERDHLIVRLAKLQQIIAILEDDPRLNEKINLLDSM